MVDRQEYERVAQELLPTLYKIAMGILRADADARDAVQQALLKAWEKRGGARSGSFRGFLTRIVINECRNIQRSRMRVFPAERVAEPAPQHVPEDLGLYEAIDGLPEKLRTPLLLRYMERYSEREIAASLGVPVTTVKNRLYRARRALEKRLSEVRFE